MTEDGLVVKNCPECGCPIECEDYEVDEDTVFLLAYCTNKSCELSRKNLLKNMGFSK